MLLVAVTAWLDRREREALAYNSWLANETCLSVTAGETSKPEGDSMTVSGAKL